MEQGLYAQVVMPFRKNLKSTEENKNTNEDKFKFQYQSAISQRWFDIDLIIWRKLLSHVNLSFIGKYFKGMTKSNIKIKFKMFEVPIGNSKCVEK